MMKKIIDEKGRLFGKISIIDVLVVVIILALGAAVYMRFFTKQTTATGKNQPFTYEIKIETIRKATAESIQPGDSIFADGSGICIGTVTDVKTESARIETPKTDGTYSYGGAENRYDAYITVEGEGVISEGRYYAGRSVEINVNDKLECYTKYCDFDAIVWNIEK